VSLTLSWTPSNDDLAVESYRIFQDGTLIGSAPFARYTDTFGDPGATHGYSIQAFDGAGRSLLSDVLSVKYKAATLPLPWAHADLGKIDISGSAVLNGGTFGMTASGIDIWDVQDSFHYTYLPLDGDKTIVARVASIPNPPNTSVKAGVMIRETLEPGARAATVIVVGGAGAVHAVACYDEWFNQ